MGKLPQTINTAMVSPKARDTARITAAKIPGKVLRRITNLLVCHLVAPNERAASLNSRGTAEKISTNKLMSNGKIITPNTIPPANTVYPVEYSTKCGASFSEIHGTTNNVPQTPY